MEATPGQMGSQTGIHTEIRRIHTSGKEEGSRQVLKSRNALVSS